MKNGTIKGDGTSRYMRIPADAATKYPTFESMRQAMVEGTFEFDLAGINALGWQVLGMLLSKENLLADDTSQKYGLDPATSTPNQVFQKLYESSDQSGYDSDFYLYATGRHPVLNAGSYNDYVYIQHLRMMNVYKDKLARTTQLTGNSETLTTYDGGSLLWGSV